MKKISDFDNQGFIEYMVRDVPEIHKERFKYFFVTTVTELSYVFDSEVFSRKVKEDTYVIDYIFPALKRVLSFFFIKEVPIFSGNPFRKKLFTVSFDLKEFIERCENNLTKYIDIIKFENLDNISEILNLTVDDYIAYKISKTVVNNHKKHFRENMIKKIID